ncbi:MAG: hypothetical protein SNJ70_10475 [Armatimonadota bacterium]
MDIRSGAAQFASLVDGSKFLGRNELAVGVHAFDLMQDDGMKVTVLWSYDGNHYELEIPDGMMVLDILGNPLENQSKIIIGAELCYFVGK